MKLFFFILLVLLAFLNLFAGSADIPFQEVLKVIFFNCDNEVFSVIILENRLPQLVTAVLSGAALSVSGLIMQTVFNNPLAGPSVLGISSASSLGAAVVTFLFSSIFLDFNTTFSIVLGSLLGAALVLVLLIFLSGIIKNNLTLLIVGLMISYLSGSIITVLNFFGTEQSVKNFTVWNMGSFAGVLTEDLPVFSLIVILGLSASFFVVKPLNLLLLGENYAQNLGLNLSRGKTVLLLIAGALTSIVTAYCGPVAFIGLATPHIARLILKTSNHAKILPLSIFLGACIALICNLLCVLPGDKGILPLNAVTPIFGVPVIIYILLTKNRIKL
ncbi:MAG: iron ABC transporter permease [Bacteroidales bacterium]|jgi:iron complex transport system permease protein|nr:iron ABC transporter permease [Bacteroidales bacterium]